MVELRVDSSCTWGTSLLLTSNFPTPWTRGRNAALRFSPVARLDYRSLGLAHVHMQEGLATAVRTIEKHTWFVTADQTFALQLGSERAAQRS